MKSEPIVCRRCAVISRGIVGHCSHVEKLLESRDRRIRRLLKKAEDLNEVLIPFIFHGKALGAMKRKDQNAVISQVGHSYMVLGCFKMLMEQVDKKYFHHKLRS